MPLSDFILISLRDGFLMSILLGTLVVGSQLLNAEMWLDDYPAQIRERFGQMSGRAKK